MDPGDLSSSVAKAQFVGANRVNEAAGFCRTGASVVAFMASASVRKRGSELMTS